MKLFNGFTEERLNHLIQNHLGRSLGLSGNGNVVELGEDYVIKFLLKRDDDFVALQALQDSIYTPTLYAYVEDNYVVMEKVKGLPLGEYLKLHKALPENIDVLIEDLIRDYGKRGWQLPDLKMDEHIFWVFDTNRIKYIDFGVMDNFAVSMEKYPDSYFREIQEQVDEALDELNQARKLGFFP